MNVAEQTESAASSAIPEPLQPGEDFDDWRFCIRPDVMALGADFARQYRIDLEVAMASVLLSAGHSLGESLQFELPHGDISPPFSLLVITPEIDPVWPGIPLRYLHSGIEKQVEQKLRLKQAREAQSAGRGDEQAEQAIMPEKRLQKASEGAGLQMLRRLVDTVTCDRLIPPFTPPPVDGLVSLTTPPRGLLRTMAGLADLQRLCLEESLLGSPSTDRSAGPSARPSFFWQLPESDAGSFFRQHGSWLQRVPFLLLRCKQAGFPNLDAGSAMVKQINQVSEALFNERHARAGNPRVFRLNAELGKPVMRFLDEAARWQAKTGETDSMRWVADLGLRFTLSLMRLEDASKPDSRLVENGMELAKFYARRRIQHLSAYGSFADAESAGIADLSSRERQAYLKICEAKRITPADLRKSFHKMPAAERDEIMAKLLSMELIRRQGKHLMQNTAITGVEATFPDDAIPA